MAIAVSPCWREEGGCRKQQQEEGGRKDQEEKEEEEGEGGQQRDNWTFLTADLGRDGSSGRSGGGSRNSGEGEGEGKGEYAAPSVKVSELTLAGYQVVVRTIQKRAVEARRGHCHSGPNPLDIETTGKAAGRDAAKRAMRFVLQFEFFTDEVRSDR